MFKNLSKTKQGELFTSSSIFFWSLFPVITILSYSGVNHIFSLAWSTLFSSIFFAIVLTIQKKWGEFKVKNVWKDLFIATLFIGILFYFFFFWGLSKTTAGNAAIMGLMEIFFAFCFFELILGERSPIKHYYGAMLMTVGAIIILFPGEIKLNLGDLLILIGTIMPPIGNYFMQKARKKVSSTFIMFFRSIVATLFLFIFAYSFSDIPTVNELIESLPFIIIIGFLLLGLSKILWIEGIHRISVPKAVSMNSIGPAFTLLFAFFILKEIPTVYQIMGLIPIMIGGILITRK